jgi:hypothetical protein
MSLEVLAPQFESDKKRYIFTFKNAPKMELTTADPTKLTITEDELCDVFVTDFLKQASKYFSKPLERAVFFKRLVYEYSTEEVELTKILETGETFRATWIPARILFYTNRYELQLTLAELEAVIVPSAIPSGFLEGLGVPGEEIDTVVAQDELPELPIAEVNIVSYGEITPEEKAKRELARKHVRQARLRASLAKLKAERMADRYYKRYGNFDMDSSESDLTSEDETGKI